MIFTVECLIRIAAMGFIYHWNAYLRDAWNWLDFLVVITGVIEIALGSKVGSVRSLRVLRVLRPLRSINSIPRMKKLI